MIGRLIGLLDLTLYFLVQVTKSSFRVAWDVIAPHGRRSPGIVATSLDLTSERQITILALLITLTPGSLTLDVSTDRRTLYIHSMFAADPEGTREKVKSGFEQRIRRVFT